MNNLLQQKVAFVTGVTGQDGAYLTEFLLQKGYVVHGLKRRSSSFNTDRIDHLYEDPHLADRNFVMHYGDMTDSNSLIRIIQDILPDEIYNLASQSPIHVSFDTPEYTANVDGIGALRVLEAVRLLGLTKKTKVYQASTSGLYGLAQQTPQNEYTAFYPRSPYAVAKLYSYWITVNYREAYGLFACNGVLFNHESPLRGETFVTRKITRAVVKIALGLQRRLYIGNLSAQRDWGHAKDYVEAMWLMLQQEVPKDYVVATGITTTVRDFIRMSFGELGIEVEFSGRGEQEKGVVIDCDEERLLSLGLDPDQVKMGETVIKVDTAYYRPTEVEMLVGDSSSVREKLGWVPKYSLEELVAEMVQSDLKATRQRTDLKNRMR